MTRVPVLSDTLDQFTMLCVMAYFWPYFLAGNMDNYKEIMKPMCFK